MALFGLAGCYCHHDCRCHGVSAIELMVRRQVSNGTTSAKLHSFGNCGGKEQEMSRLFADTIFDSCDLLHDVWWVPDLAGMVGNSHCCNDCYGSLWGISMQSKRAR